MAVPIIWELMADLNDDGTYEADFTSRLKMIEYGFGREDALAAFSPRRLRATLGNQDSRFSPKYTSGPYGANLKRGKLCRLRASLGQTFPDTTNIVENPSLEAEIDGWIALGASTAVRITTKARYGRASAKVTVANAAGEGVVLATLAGLEFAVSPSTAYAFCPRVAVPAGKQMQILIEWYTSGSVFLSSISANFDGVGVDTWLWPFVTGTSPGTAAKAVLYIQARSL